MAVTRTEHDTMGAVEVDATRLWGAQTEYSRTAQSLHGLTSPALAFRSCVWTANHDMPLSLNMPHHPVRAWGPQTNVGEKL